MFKFLVSSFFCKKYENIHQYPNLYGLSLGVLNENV